jgi:hypothetical protein
MADGNFGDIVNLPHGFNSIRQLDAFRIHQEKFNDNQIGQCVAQLLFNFASILHVKNCVAFALEIRVQIFRDSGERIANKNIFTHLSSRALICPVQLWIT